MKIAIIYESKTGNTKLVAEAINEICIKDNDTVLIPVETALEENFDIQGIDFFFLGSWTDKGDCGQTIKNFANALDNKKIALFGTAGFGGSQDYFDKLTARFSSSILDSNRILGSFYCQGKMPQDVRNHYQAMLQQNPQDKNLKVTIANFDKAQTHPNEKDLNKAKEFAKKMIDNL
ncbi:MAG: flavodoxin [Candidatus Moranbacteria bacterium]|nr:flavodoxin [Candidatus Moranbacteria bacterium]